MQRSMRVPRSVVATVLLAVTATTVGAPVSSAALPVAATHPQVCAARHWIASWSASPTDAFAPYDPSLHAVPPVLTNQTLRMVITPHFGGSRLRVHLSNRFSATATDFGHVTIARQSTRSGVDHVRTVTFHRSQSVTVAAGQDVVSDPVKLTFAAFTPLAVSVYVVSSGPPTKHWNANATSYYSLPGTGDLTTSLTGKGFASITDAWLYVDGLDVRASPDARTIVAFGDSITDGFVAADRTDQRVDHSVADKNGRYPDDLQRRLDGAGLPIAITNAGIGGNKLTSGTPSQQGPSGVSRFDTDALAQPGVAGVLVLEGINDLGIPPTATGSQVIAALKSIIAMSHHAGVKVWLGTVLPASNSLIDGTATAPMSETYREQINRWILHQHQADGVVDFAKVMRDPSNHTILRSAYSGPDGLHPNLAGYHAMARAVPLKLLASAPHSC